MYSVQLLDNIYSENEEVTKAILKDIDERKYGAAKSKSSNEIEGIKIFKSTLINENELNAAYILTSFYELFFSISCFWDHVENDKYYDSWCSLQDGLDSLRQVKKFHRHQNRTLKFFESQLVNIENLYPYELFSSPGFIVERFECSICKHDIDSDLCPHMKGELYRGEIAYAVAKEIKYIDHVAFVTKPTNKRLVIGCDDSHSQFGLFKEMVDHFNIGDLSPLGFSTLKKHEFMRPDPDWKKLPRNSKCYCGSGKKYKKCCVDSNEIKQVHVDFMGHHIFS